MSYFTNSSGYRTQPSDGRVRAGPLNASYSAAAPSLVNPYATQIGYWPTIEHDVHKVAPAATMSLNNRPSVGRGGVGTRGAFACNQSGCFFRGSEQDVRTHKMDRHLIFPRGWSDGRKRSRVEESEDVDIDEEGQARLAG